MRKTTLLWMALLGVLVGIMLTPTVASATIFTLTQAQLLDQTGTNNGQKFINISACCSETSRNSHGAGVDFLYSMPGSPGWISMQYAYKWDPPGGLGAIPPEVQDLTGYSSYGLYFLNHDDDWFNVNVFINTGWTDDPYFEPDNYYQNTWTWLAPGASAYVLLDLTGLLNLNHVTAIGFNIGTNLLASQGDYGCYDSGAVVCDGDLHVQPTPEPATLFLLGTGLVGLGAWGRRRRKAGLM